MSKAERRKRARQRARERERASGSEPSAAPVDAASAEPGAVGEGTASLSVAAHFAEPEPVVHQAAVPTESEFITGPVVPRMPGPVRTARVLSGPSAPLALAALGAASQSVVDAASPVGVEGADDDQEDASDEDEGGDDDGEDGEDGEGEEDDEDALDEQDALFNLACSAVEQGDALTFNELVLWLLAAEVDDPRLALVSQLLVTEEDSIQAPTLSGSRVLAALQQIGLEAIVTEARETVAAAAPDDEDTEEERALMRATARELNAQAARELERSAPPPPKELKARKASELKTAAGRKAR